MRKPIYWWSGEIGERRAECIRARRKYIRAHANGNQNDREMDKAREKYKAKKKNLQDMIRKTKKSKWDDLCLEINEKPLGRRLQNCNEKIRGKSETHTQGRRRKKSGGAAIPQVRIDNTQ